MPKIVAFIPARFSSTRFPGKPLAPISGKPMIQHVYERAQACPDLDETYVATADQRIVLKDLEVERS
jgi:3-deoxy-manno-octulosonate cytidylyltransferase (CMP-KDO synthetase)